MPDIEEGIFSDKVMEQLLDVSEDELAADRVMEDFTNQEDQVDKTDERRESFSAQYVF